MSKPRVESDYTASDHTIEKQSKTAGPAEAASVTGKHRDIKPETIMVSHQATDTEHRQKFPRDSNARIVEESSKGLDGRRETPLEADSSWLP